MHYTTSCNTQSTAPEDGQNNCPKHVELTGIINKSLLLHLVGCQYYLYIIIFFLKLAKQSQFIPLHNFMYFITLTFLVRKIFTFYTNDVLLFKRPFPGPSGYTYLILCDLINTRWEGGMTLLKAFYCVLVCYRKLVGSFGFLL